MVELLAPAGDLEKLKIAVLYGADAVFIGGHQFSLRARASNFTIEDIKEGCDFAHRHGCKIHVTTNIIPHNADLKDLITYLKDLEKAGVDAIICASYYIFQTAKTYTKLECHISTQQSTLNLSAVKVWEDLKADRVVLGRELSLEQIKYIKENAKTEIEVFIHGGMCVAVSGRCMLSNIMTRRDANRGGCAHSCRWNYDLYDRVHKVNQDGYFAMSSKDLQAIRMIPALMDIKVDSFKIEGRMKSIHYIATVIKTYRMLIDEYAKTGKINDFSYYENEIAKAENRQTSIGFLKGLPTKDEQLYNSRSEQPTQEFIGIVLEYNKDTKMVKMEQRNFFKPFSKLEAFGPQLVSTKFDIQEIYDENGVEIEVARHPKQIVMFKTDLELKPYDMIRLSR